MRDGVAARRPAPPSVRRLGSRIARSLPFWAETRLLVQAVRQGLWRSLVGRDGARPFEQRVLTWPTSIPDLGDATAVLRHLRAAGVRVREGSNTFYLPPQPGLAHALGRAVDHYPPHSGYKILRDCRRLEDAHYLRPDRQTLLRRRLIGTPRDQLVAANYLHHLDLGPRIWDFCILQAGSLSMPAFVVEHVDGTPPALEEYGMFLERLRTALSTTELRITIADWERSKDFRCPRCNDNLLRDARGRLAYIDFQNFTVRDRRRLSGAPEDGSSVPTRQRFDAIRDALRGSGLQVDGRLVLEIRCGSGVMLHHALASGAWWAVGLASPERAWQAQALAVARSVTRLEIVPADPKACDDVRRAIPDWLRPHLAASIVLVLDGHRGHGLPAGLAALPWRALVYEAPDVDPAAVRRDVGVLTAGGARVVVQSRIRGLDARERALLVVVRDATAAAIPAR